MAHRTREPAQLAKVLRHTRYYLRGGDITFVVENHLFRVHSYFFDRESTFFHQKLSAASPPGEDRVGASDRNAFTLENVRSIDFERFLWVFYNPKYSLYDTTVEEWTSILHLSDEWSFVEVKNLAIRELEKLDIEPIERVFIYHQYNIDRAYLITSYAAICTRSVPLNIYEGRRLGLETSLKIAEGRERIRAVASEKSGARSPTFADFAPNDVDAIIKEVFEIVVRSNPLSGGGGPSPISGPSSANGSHSKPGSNAWPPAQTVVTSATPPPPAAPHQRQQQQPTQQQREQPPFSNSFGESPQSPTITKPASAGFSHFLGTAFGAVTQSSPTGSEGRAEEQSPVNVAGSPLPTGGSGEPPSASADSHSPVDGEQGTGGATDGPKTPVDGVKAEEAQGGGDGARGSDELQTPIETTTGRSVAKNPFAALGADGGDDEDEAEENESDGGAAEEEKQDGDAANGSFRNPRGKGGNVGSTKEKATTTNGTGSDLHVVGTQGVGGGEAGGATGEREDGEAMARQGNDDGKGDTAAVEKEAEEDDEGEGEPVEEPRQGTESSVDRGITNSKVVSEVQAAEGTTNSEVGSMTTGQNDPAGGEGHREVDQVDDKNVGDDAENGDMNSSGPVKQKVDSAGSDSTNPDLNAGTREPISSDTDFKAYDAPNPVDAETSQPAKLEHDAEDQQAGSDQIRHASGDEIQVQNNSAGAAGQGGEDTESRPTDALHDAKVENGPLTKQETTPTAPSAIFQLNGDGVKIAANNEPKGGDESQDNQNARME